MQTIELKRCVEMTSKLHLLGVLLILVMIASSTIVVIYALAYTPLPENERTLNAYATFESTCSYRGYNRSECLLIWSGR